MKSIWIAIIMQIAILLMVMQVTMAGNFKVLKSGQKCARSVECDLNYACDKGACRKVSEIQARENEHIQLPKHARATLIEPTEKCMTDQINAPLIKQARAIITNSDEKKRSLEATAGGYYFPRNSPYEYLNKQSSKIPSCGYTICDVPEVRDVFKNKRNKNYHITFWVNQVNDIGLDMPLARTIAQEAVDELTKAYTNAIGFTFTWSIKKYVVGNYKRSIMTSSQAECKLAEALGKTCLYPSQVKDYDADWQSKGFQLFMEDRMAKENTNGWAYLPGGSVHGIMAIKKDALRAGKTTIVHELGHALGLQHTFNKFSDCTGECHETDSNGGTTGDLVPDTKPVPMVGNCEPHSGIQQCGRNQWDLNTFRNYMGYSYSECRKKYGHFTYNQLQRMLCYSYLNPNF